MTPTSLGLIFVSIVLTSAAQLLMKAGMSSPSVAQVMSGGTVLNMVLAIATSPFVIGGLFCFGLSAATWLLVLSRVDVSQAYPFIALGIAATAAGGLLFFGEALSLLRLGGVAIIGIGVLMVALS
jgi:multidrug transporter EmrE-like cation transporter